MAFIALSKTTVKEVAGVEPKLTAVAFVKPRPMIDTVFPPATEPLLGFTKMMRGGMAMLEVFGRLPLVSLPLDALTDVAPAIARYWRDWDNLTVGKDSEVASRSATKGNAGNVEEICAADFNYFPT
jgi:hypothetical protein